MTLAPLDHQFMTAVTSPAPTALTLGQKRSMVLTLGLQFFRSKPCELPMTSPRIFQFSLAIMPLLPLLFNLCSLYASPSRWFLRVERRPPVLRIVDYVLH
jgi:hypothetical protein